MRSDSTSAAARAKRLLPLYDTSAPITCTISDDEVPARLALLDRLRAAATSVERTDTGLLLQLPRDGAVEADARAFAVDEKRCCQFWGFAVVDGPDSIVLRWDGPPSVAELLDDLHELLRSDAPIERVKGLL